MIIKITGLKMMVALMVFFLANRLIAQSQFPFTNDPRFSETRDLAMHLVKNYPPETHVVVGLGRTTGVTGAWVQEISMNNDYFRHAPVQELKSINKLSPQEIEAVWEAIIPSRAELGGKKLVIHRVLWSGQTLDETNEGLVKFLRKKGYDLPLTYDTVTSTGVLYGVNETPGIEFKKNRISRKSDDAFRDELDRTNKSTGPKLIEYGDKKPATPEMLLKNGRFIKSNPGMPFKKAISEGACMEALSHFQ